MIRSLQLYDSFRARLRQARYASGHAVAERTCKGNVVSGELPCEGFAPALCKTRTGPILCNGGVPPPQDPGLGSLYAACDNAATLFMAQAYRWVLDVHDFTASDSRGDQCASRVRSDPLSFGLVLIPIPHLMSMMINAAWTPHGPARRDGRRGSQDVALVLNQFAHVHAFVQKVTECYAAAGIGSTPAPWLGSLPGGLLSGGTRCAEIGPDQGRWASTLGRCSTTSRRASHRWRGRLQGYPSRADQPKVSNLARILWQILPHGAPRRPLNASTLVSATMGTKAAFSHQLVFALNDVSRAAFHAHGHSIIDVESMLGVRVDAYPASDDGDGDKLHFCQPGPPDWAMDVVLKRVTAEWRKAKGSGRATSSVGLVRGTDKMKIAYR